MLYGRGADDILYGGSGNDTLYGGSEDDTLYGGSGADSLYGGNGDDTLYGGDGNDTLKGGNGSDTFQIKADVGRDIITDYDSDNDSIELLGGLVEGDLTLNLVGGDTRIKYNDSLLAIIQDTIAADITFI